MQELRENAPLEQILDKASQMKIDTGKTLTKEQLRTLEDDQDKDEDSCAEKEPPTKELDKTSVDLASVRRTFQRLFGLQNAEERQRILDTLNSVLGNVVNCMQFDVQCTKREETVERILTAAIVIFDIFSLGELARTFNVHLYNQ